MVTGAEVLRFPRRGVEGLLVAMDQSNDRVMQPGDRVRLEVDFPDAPERYRRAATQAALDRLKAGGIVVADDAPATLYLRAATVPTGETVDLSWQDLKKLGQHETLKPYSVRCASELRREGRPAVAGPAMEPKMDLGGRYQTITITDDSDSAREFFERQVWKRVVGWAGFAVPGPTTITAAGQLIALPLNGRVKDGVLETTWPQGYTPPPETPEPSEDAPPPDAAATRTKWVWIAGGCGAVVVLLAVAAVGLFIRRARRKPAAPPNRKRPPVLKPRRRPAPEPDDE